MGAGTAQYPRGRFPGRCGIGGRWHEPGRPGLRRLTRWHEPSSLGPIFKSAKFSGTFLIAGVTRDNTGAPLGTCDVHLFETPSDLEVRQLVSDGSGNFAFQIGNNSVPHYIVAYKPGAPDVAGTTRNDLYATIAP
jgi:hypothetical protein